MKVLYVCTELYPLLKTGGLADVGAALPGALQAAGCEVRVLLPAFAAIAAGVRIEGEAMAMPATGGPEIARAPHPAPKILSGRVRATGQTVYLLDAPTLYQRPGGPYLDASGHDWPDNAERFALLGWAAAWIGLGADRRWQPDVLHAHDWHAGLAPVYLQLLASAGPRPASVFTIHNLAYQGIFPRDALASLALPESLFTIDGYEYHGHLSFMKAGLQFADALTTVSPRYAREITTPEQGCGLDGVLRQRAERLSGILNGVDYTVWNPARDPLISTPYDIGRMAGKAGAKQALQGLLGLELRPDALVFGVVSRLSDQKGFHLVPEVLDDLAARGGQLVVLGSGDAGIEASLRDAAMRHPGQVVLRIGYDETLAHRIIAGSDVLLVPSRFEPCGLTQLYALRYGTLPLVHGVGGLADTVADSTPANLARGNASGFVFHAFNAEALRQALHRAFALYRQPADWASVQRHGMRLRFDWQVAAQAYCALYHRIAAQPGPACASVEPDPHPSV